MTRSLLDMPSALYAQGVAQGRWQDDPVQRDALVVLDRMHAQLCTPANSNWWQRLRGHMPAPVQGVYLWGAVGRGKTFLVDLFFVALPIEQKLRLHFHRFMGRVHSQLAKLRGQSDPLRAVAAHFASQARVVCLD